MTFPSDRRPYHDDDEDDDDDDDDDDDEDDDDDDVDKTMILIYKLMCITVPD